MSIKSLVFFLFLYICLIWVVAFSRPDIQAFGLFWTAAGLIAVLAWIVIAWLWGWFRIAKARAAAKPKPSPQSVPAVLLHEDDAALLALIQEAKVSLSKSANALAQNVPFSALPLYLLVGPEAAGKTSTFLNSSLEPVSLSGQPAGGGQVIPTRVGNIWLARNALFIELGGRAFSGDLGRWASLLRILRGGSTLSRWQRLFKEPDSGLNLRGILAFGDVKEFIGASSPQGRERLDRLSSLWRDRLGAITEVFGRQFPVYWVTTKTDNLPFFGDYFSRLRGTELGQIFGCTLPFTPLNPGSELASAQAENKRLTKSTSPLLHRLAERRVVHLAREDDPTRKPGVYEFPREMRRIRPTLVQFLVDVFRPHPLRHTPFLRGYYFTGTCEEEIGAAPSGTRSNLSDDSVMSDASAIFKGDATQVFKDADAARMAAPARRSGLSRRWAFVPELFTGIVLPDNVIPRQVTVQPDQRVDLYRKLACGAVCFVSFLLCLCFLRSWFGNSRLLESVNSGDSVSTRNPNVDDLKALDKLHQQASELLDYDRNGAPWRLRWGLYTGGAVVQPATDLYFRRFADMLLIGLNNSITNTLKSVPATAGVDDPAYGSISTLLKTHLMISSGACKPDPVLVSRVLKQTLDESNPSNSSEWKRLAERQIDFYTAQLPDGNPVKLAQDSVAVDRARQYLSSIQGADRLYTQLLNQAEKRFSTPQTLVALAPNYAKVLVGPAEVGGLFTPEGWSYIKDASKNVKANSSGDSCLQEPKGLVAGYRQDAELEHKIQGLFVRDYIDNWRKFVNGFSVLHYNNAADAALKLNLLADHRSPLLAVFALASKNTNFVVPPPSAIEKSIAPINSVFNKAKETLNGIKKDPPPADAKQIDSTADIVAAFQPVQWVVPPAGDTWVSEKNNAYVDALALLGQSMDAIAHNTNADPAIDQAATQNYDKALNAARQLEERLSPNTNGLDTSVQRLLEEPIVQARNLIPVPLDIPKKTNSQAQRFCSGIASTLRKFPFHTSTEDVPLGEFAYLFAPGSGAIWKFEADTLADSVVKDGSQWKPKDGAKLPITGGMLSFLNHAQQVTDAFFPKGGNQPQLLYTLRPKLDPAFQNTFVELEVDGQLQQWRNSLQHQFVWPAAAGGSGGRAVGRVVTGEGVSFSFSSYGGVWAVFRMMREAEPRLQGSKIVEWKYSRGREGLAEPIKPAPVRLEFVEFPAGADVFNPKFFDGLQCPVKAVQELQ